MHPNVLQLLRAVSQRYHGQPHRATTWVSEKKHENIIGNKITLTKETNINVNYDDD